MKLIKPTLLTDAMLASSTAVEAYSVWSSVTAYALNTCVILASSKRAYKCIQGPSTNNSPDTSPLYWTDIGPMNKWAMFDSMVSTQTTGTGSITVALDTGYMNSLALLGLVGDTATITATDGPGGAVVYTKTIALDGTIISDWYQYFYEPGVQLTTAWLTDLPPYLSCRLTVTVSGSGAVAIGMLMFGTFYDIGDTQLNPNTGILSYSKKTTDAYGVTTFVPGGNAKRLSVSLNVLNAQLNKVYSLLASLDAVPCMWIGADDIKYGPLAIFGFYRDFSLVVQYQRNSLCSLEIEGLI